jgi:hypothetical protein
MKNIKIRKDFLGEEFMSLKGVISVQGVVEENIQR